ncbi:MAG: 4Fe-4S dicluster domain-containing protein [Nitrospina sp.]|jgi:MauM/NapG family ferredoxin protein|nr:4Fe-4S dicluster domain-containing protein [Nitrospina sp.]MBT6716977.1 4Fe-4S dicluster domain-containing protein [Nitrospina sp.]
MKFRYNLAKKTFKGKKIVERGVEDLIDEDQRGNHSSVDAPNPLSLDKETITPVEPEEPKEVSRRDLFSFGRLGDFAEAVEEDHKKQPKKSQKDKEDEEAEELETGDLATDEAPEEIAEEENAAKEEEPKQGFFKRLVSKFKSDPIPEDGLEIDSISEKKEESFTEALDTAEKELLPEAGNNIFALEEGEEEEPEYDRRNLIRQGFHFFAKPAVENVQSKIDNVNKAVDKITKRVPVLRPPGAISEKAFLQACSRCDECIHACPKDAIQRAPKKMGFLIHNTPYIDPMRNPCVMCTDLPCIPACPDGALLPVQELSDVSMGYAVLDKKKCQAYGDTFCQQCVIDCPVPGAIHQVNDQPIIDKNICTGCGVCMRSCSTVNIPLAIKIKPQMVIDYQLHKKQLEKEKARIEAERLEAKRLEAEQQAAEQENEEVDAEGETRGIES